MDITNEKAVALIQTAQQQLGEANNAYNERAGNVGIGIGSFDNSGIPQQYQKDIEDASTALYADLGIAQSGAPQDPYPNPDALYTDCQRANTLSNNVVAGASDAQANVEQFYSDVHERFQVATGLSLTLVLLVAAGIVAVVILSDVAILKGARA